MRRLLTTALVAALLGGCATTEQAATALRSKWIGKNSDQFALKYGAPTGGYTMNDGRKMLVWGNHQTFTTPTYATTQMNSFGGFGVATTTFSGGDAIAIDCQVTMVTTPAGVIQEIRPSRDTFGVWTTSRCNEIYGS